MYRTCIFCSADLGANESIEAFPVGRSIAFDAAKGRLWAVCGRCCRWNLAPLEERWEAVEDAERLFRDSRLRVQSENIGLCKLSDGTRLIRVGEALAGELAAWRYGDRLVRRRRLHLIGLGVAATAGVAAAGGMLAAGIGNGIWYAWSFGRKGWERRQGARLVHRLPAAQSPTGRAVDIRRWQVQAGRLAADESGGVALHLPRDTEPRNGAVLSLRGESAPGPLVVPPPHTGAVLNRAMVHINRKGASRDHVRDALNVLHDAGSAADFLLASARDGRMLHGGVVPHANARGLATVKVGGLSYQAPPAGQPDPRAALALEMALHEETERRALQGELAALEEAWRQAEEIAAIADALPDGLVRAAHTPVPGAMRG